VSNPEAWATKATYLRAEVEPYEDVDLEKDCTDLEERARVALEGVMRLQGEDEQPGLKAEVLKDFTFGRDGFWKLVDLWQDFQSHKLVTKRALANGEMVKMIMEFVQENKDDIEEAQRNDGEVALEIDSLPLNIQYEVKRFQESTAEGIEDFRKRALFRIQAFVQCRSHEERLQMIIETFEEEEKTLAARSALRGLFK
jgi:hypothetical protein